MKKILLLSVLFLVFRMSFSQTKDSLSVEEKVHREKNIQAGNPFKRFGYKPKIATLSKGKYLEFHDLDSIIKIGSFSYHVKKKEITGYAGIDPNDSEAGLSPEVISRWMSPDPLSEEFPSWSPYNFVQNNPIRLIDPDGRAPFDIIHVNSSGYITKVVEAKGPHIVVDDKSNQLNLNDSNFDQQQLEIMMGSKDNRYSVNWNREDNKTRLFTPFTNKQMADKFNNLDIGGIKSNYETAKQIKWLGPPLHVSEEAYLGHLGRGTFDFADDMNFIAREGGNYNTINEVFPPDGTGGFIKFQDENNLYNVYDAGNFLTGKAFNMIGVDKNKILQGANWNSIFSLDGKDSDADQRALSNGIDYKGIKWKE